MADRYQRRADVLNRGYSGYNTDWFLRLASTNEGRSDLFDHENVMLVTLFFGANDASDPMLNGRQHVPLGGYEANMRDIVALTRSNFGEDVGIILISPPPVCHDGRLRFQREAYGDGATGKLERTLELSGAYARGAARVANEMGVPFLDLWTGMQERENWRDFLSDGLHFSALGNEFVGKAVLDTIDRCLPQLSVKPAPDTGNINSFSTCLAMQRMGPWHDEIDLTKPDRGFET